MNKHKVIQAMCDCRRQGHGRVDVDGILRALGRQINRDERDRMLKMLREDFKDYVDSVKPDGSMRVRQRALKENEQQEQLHKRRVELVWKAILVVIIIIVAILGGLLSFAWGRRLFG